MDIQHIVSALRDEKDRLEQAIAALEGGNGRKRGRRAGFLGNGRRGKRRRRLSAAAKKRISEMMKKRWAERKRAAKTV